MLEDDAPRFDGVKTAPSNASTGRNAVIVIGGENRQ